LLKSVGVDADPAIVDDASPHENSDMTDNLTDDEVERARRAGEAFGRQIGGRAMDEVRRVALTLAEVNTQWFIRQVMWPWAAERCRADDVDDDAAAVPM
jgi:hypothetical protein